MAPERPTSDAEHVTAADVRALREWLRAVEVKPDARGMIHLPIRYPVDRERPR